MTFDRLSRMFIVTFILLANKTLPPSDQDPHNYWEFYNPASNCEKLSIGSTYLNWMLTYPNIFRTSEPLAGVIGQSKHLPKNSQRRPLTIERDECKDCKEFQSPSLFTFLGNGK